MAGIVKFVYVFIIFLCIILVEMNDNSKQFLFFQICFLNYYSIFYFNLIIFFFITVAYKCVTDDDCSYDICPDGMMPICKNNICRCIRVPI